MPKIGGTEWATNINIHFFWHSYLGLIPLANGFVQEHFQCSSEKICIIYRMLNSTSNLKYESEMYFAQALLKKQFITALNLSDKRKGDFSLLISCIEAMTN